MSQDAVSFEKWREAYRRANLPTRCHTHGCEAKAVGWLYAPDGKANPGGAICEKHGQVVTKEFSEKLMQHWYIVPLLDHYAYAAMKGAAS